MPASSVGFTSIVRALTKCRLEIIRRQGNPQTIATTGFKILHEQSRHLQVDPQNVEDVTLVVEFAKALRTVLPAYKKFAHIKFKEHTIRETEGIQSPSSSPSSEVSLLPPAYLLQEEVRYKLEGLIGNVLQSNLAPTTSIDSMNSLTLALKVISEVAGSNSGGLSAAKRDGFQRCYRLFEERGHEMSTWELLELLEGCHEAYTSPVEFKQGLGVTMSSLLPTKQRLHMESHVQRCKGSRRILYTLRERTFNHIDVNTALNLFASTGLYDKELVNAVCDTMVSSSNVEATADYNHRHHQTGNDRRDALRASKHLYNLGVMNHRHEGVMKALGSQIHLWKLPTDAVRELMVGLAMLRYIPPLTPNRSRGGRKSLDHINPLLPPSVRGRGGKQHQKPLLRNEESAAVEGPADVLVGGLMGHAFRQASPVAGRSKVGEEVDLAWYVDVCHASRVLGIVPHKLLLRFARTQRTNIRQLDLMGTLKVLYAFGGVNAAEDPILQGDPALLQSWNSKGLGMLKAAASTLHSVDGNPAKGAAVMNALRFCNIHDHPLVPKVLNLDRVRISRADVADICGGDDGDGHARDERTTVPAATNSSSSGKSIDEKVPPPPHPNPPPNSEHQQLPEYRSYSSILDDVMRTWCGETGTTNTITSPQPDNDDGMGMPSSSSAASASTREDEIVAALTQFNRVGNALLTPNADVSEREVADACLHLANVSEELEPHEACEVLTSAAKVAAVCGTSSPASGLMVVMFEVAVAGRVLRRLWELRQVLDKTHCTVIKNYNSSLDFAVLPQELAPHHESLIRRVSQDVEDQTPKSESPQTSTAAVSVRNNEAVLRRTMQYFVDGRLAMSDA